MQQKQKLTREQRCVQTKERNLRRKAIRRKEAEERQEIFNALPIEEKLKRTAARRKRQNLVKN